jgi:small-conductance mechanosensitive channel
MPTDDTTTRIKPGAPGRAEYLDELGRSELADELALLEASLAEARTRLQAVEGNAAELEAQALTDARAELEQEHAADRAEAVAAAEAALRDKLGEAHAAALEQLEAAQAVELEAVRDAAAKDLVACRAALTAQLDDLREQLEDQQPGKGLEAKLAAARAEARKGYADTRGMVPLVLHAGGVEWNGTHRRLVRCGAKGELAELWLVQVGDKMLTKHGQRIPFMPYRRVGKSLQDKVAHTLDEAQAALAKLGR